MAGLRTLRITLAPLLGDLIVAALLPHLPIDIVGVLETRESLATVLANCSPDLLLLGLLDDEWESVAHAMLALLPTMRIVAVTAGGDQAWLIERGVPTLFFRDFSLRLLIDGLVARLNLQPPRG